MAPSRAATRKKAQRSGTKASYKEDSDSMGSDSDGGASDGDFEVARPASAKKAPASHKKKQSTPPSRSKAKAAEPDDDEGEHHSSESEGDSLVGSPKAAPKKGGRKKHQSSLAKKGKFAAKAAPRAKPKDKEAPADENDSLLDVAAGKPNSHAGVASGWWSDYADASKKEAAVHTLVGMLLSASGLQQSLDPALFVEAEDVDVDNEVAQIAEQWAAEGSKDNFIGKKGKVYAKPRKNYEGFFRKLVELAPRESLPALSDQHFVQWMCALSTCKSPGLRQVATLAGLQMLVGLALVCGDILLEISSKERQKQAVGTASSKAAKEKVQRLTEDLEALGEAKGDLEREMDRLFNSFFVHRKGDINPEIRTMCVEALGLAVMAYGAKFLDNQYTKYLGWSLHDKSEDVRGAALDAIHEVFSESHTKELDMFVDRFKERIVQMATDVKPAVAVKAFRICTLLAKLEALPENLLVSLYKQIMCDEEPVRSAAATFIDEVYVSGDLLAPYEETLATTSVMVKKDEFFLKGMVELLHICVGEDVEDFTEIIRSLTVCSIDWGYKKWTLMCDILMDEEDEDKLTEEQKETLVKIVTGSLDCLTSSDKEDMTKAVATLELLPHVHKMLKKWSTSPVLVGLVLRLVSHFDLAYLTSRQLKTATGIVSAAQDVLSKGQDEEMLREACAVLELFHTSHYQLRDMVLPTCAAFLDEAVAHLRAAGDALRAGTKLSATQGLWLKRVCMLGGCVDLGDHDSAAWSIAINMLENIGSDADADDASDLSAPESALVCVIATQGLFWRVKACLAGGGEAAVRAMQMRDIVDDRNLLVNALESVVARTAHPFALRMQATALLCDVAQLFGKSLAATGLLGVEGADEVAEAMLEVGRLAEADAFTAESSLAAIPKHDKWCRVLRTTHGQGFPEEEQEDEHNLAKLLTVCSGKILAFWRPIEEEQDDMAVGSSLMATTASFNQYSPAYKKEVLDLARGELGSVLVDFSPHYTAEFWLSAHQALYLRMLTAQERGLDVMRYSMNMVEEIGALEFDSDTALHYLSKALEWALDGANARTHTPFLEAVEQKMGALTEVHARDLMDRLDVLCSALDLGLEGGGGGLRASKVEHFRDALADLLDADAASEERPGASDRKPKLRRGRQGSDDDDGKSISSISSFQTRTPASHKRAGSAAKQSRARKSKRKSRALSFDGPDPADRDDEGFVRTKRAHV